MLKVMQAENCPAGIRTVNEKSTIRTMTMVDVASTVGATIDNVENAL